MCRKNKADDILTCVNFRILLEYVTGRENWCYSTGMHGIVVHPFSTILKSNKAEWWQLVDPENPDNKVRLVRNLYIIVSLCVG